MQSQFAHIDGYGRRPSKRKIGGRAMYGVAYEAERRFGFCDHVAQPKKPKLLYGCTPSEAVQIAEARAEQAVDGNGDKLRIDGLIFLGGVASFPTPWTEIRNNRAEAERLRRWLAYLLEHLKNEYGVLLHYVLLHEDEAYPHVHWGCIPELGPDRRMRISTVHPGRAAYERARAAGGDNAAGQRAYRKAMTKWQDDIHINVYAKVDIGRIGPRRQRLTAVEYKARKTANAALARTLQAEKEIKAKWREEVRRDVEKSFAQELKQWRTACEHLQTLLRDANRIAADRQAEIAKLQRELAELRGEHETAELQKFTR